MTHARTNAARPTRTRDVGTPAVPAGPRPDAAALADLRALADALDLPGACPHEPCRRGRGCRGPLKQPIHVPDSTMPACLADGFDAMLAPVAAWRDLLGLAARVEAKLPDVRAGEGDGRRA